METKHTSSSRNNQSDVRWEGAGLLGGTKCQTLQDGTVSRRLRGSILGTGFADYRDATEDPCPTFNKCGACPNRLENRAEGLLGERMGATILRVSDAASRPFRAARELVGKLLGRYK